MNGIEFRVIWKREGLRPKRRNFSKRSSAERFLILFGPEPWLFYGADPDKRCCSGVECACGGMTERESTADERSRMPPLEYVRLESRPVGDWSPLPTSPSLSRGLLSGALVR